MYNAAELCYMTVVS